MSKEIITDDKTMLYGEPQIFSRVKCDCSKEINDTLSQLLQDLDKGVEEGSVFTDSDYRGKIMVRLVDVQNLIKEMMR